MPDHTIPGTWIPHVAVAGEWVPYHTVPGQWVGEATATTASAWPVASIEVTTYAPTTAYDRSSDWPVASIEVTAYVPTTSIVTPSAWPAASVEVTTYAPTTSITYASFWPVASAEITTYVPTTSYEPDTAIYVYPNSLWRYTTEEQGVSYWLGLMEEEDAGTDIFFDGENQSFFANGAGFPSADPLNQVQGSSTIRSHLTTNPGVDFTDVVFTCNNFVQGSTSSTEYNNHRDRMDALIDHWTDTLVQTPVYWVQEVVPEGDAFFTSPISSATRDEFDDFLDEIRSGSYPDWFETLLSALEGLQPSADIRVAKMASYFQNAIQGTALIDLDPDDFFVDLDPHGTDLHYAMKAMIFFGYTEGFVTTSSAWTTGLPSTFTTNYTAIAARIEDLVLGNAVTPQAFSSNDWSVATSSTSLGLDFAITTLPETVTDIDYSTDDGSTWASLGETTTGTYTVTTASAGGSLAASTSYTTRLRMVNATGDGQGSRSKAGTSAAASGVSSNWPAASIAVTSYVPTTVTTLVSAWPSAGIEITTYVPTTGNNVSSDWPAASIEVTTYVPTTVTTVASSWPVASAEITTYAPTTSTTTGGINAVTFDGTADWLSGLGLSSSDAQITIAIGFTPTSGWSANDQLISEPAALFANSATGVAHYDDVTGFNAGTMPGTLGTTTYGVLVNLDRGGGLSSSQSFQARINGSTPVVAASGTGANADFSGMTIFSDEGGELLAADVTFIWIAVGSNNEDYSDFFDGSNEPLSGFSSSSTVDSVTPDIFIYDRTATQWNSGTDNDGNSYTMNGAVVDA